MPLFNDIVITSNGPSEAPTITANSVYNANLRLSAQPISDDYNLTGSNFDVDIFRSDFVGSIVSYDDSYNIIRNNRGSITGEDAQISLLGANTQWIVNSGEMSVPITFGSGQGIIFNAGLLSGSMRMGGGDDFFFNAFGESHPSDNVGIVSGPLRMGSGNDVVQNASQMGRVFLGNGNDSYSVRDGSGTFDVPDASAVIVRGGVGNDTIFGGAADDLFYGDANNDILNGHGGNDTLIGGQGKDTIRGGNDDDRLMGNQSKDNLFGGNGDDTLSGGNGEDRLIGGRGEDRLIGGSGGDTFVFSGDSGSDTITDFDGGADVIQLQYVAQGSDAGPVGWFGDEEVLSFITYADGDAILDLTGLYTAFNDLYDSAVLSQASGIQILFQDVEEGDLTGDSFNTPQDISPPEVIELL